MAESSSRRPLAQMTGGLVVDCVEDAAGHVGMATGFSDGGILVVALFRLATPSDGERFAPALVASANRVASPRAIVAEALAHCAIDPATASITLATFDPAEAHLRYTALRSRPPLLGTPDGSVVNFPSESSGFGLRASDDWQFTLAPATLVALVGDTLEASGLPMPAIADAIRAAQRARRGRRIVHAARALAPDGPALAFMVASAPAAMDFTATAVPFAAPLVRRSVRAFADAVRLRPEQRFAFELAVGEAVANAAEHAFTHEPGTVRVRALRSGERLTMLVEDDGTWKEARASDERGRGLGLMRRLMHDVDVRCADRRTSVALTLDLERAVPVYEVTA